MCRGDDQQLLDLRMMPCFSMASNSAFAAASFSASRRLNLEVTGLPLVMMW
jgi:hypothetical protein